MYIRDRRCFLSRSFPGAFARVALLPAGTSAMRTLGSRAGDGRPIKTQNHDSASGIDPPSRELDNSVAIQWQSVVVSRQPVSAEWPTAARPASPRDVSFGDKPCRYARAQALRYLGEHVDKTRAWRP